MVSTSGFTLGVLGGLLDFASATTMVINQGGNGMMNGYLASGYLWAAVLVALGVLVVVVAVLSVMSTGMRHLRAFALMMVGLGILMAIIGSLMSSGLVEGSSLLFSYGMVIVGVLMAINGGMMLRTPMSI